MSQKFIDDGFASYLVKDAKFVGKYQIPALPKHDSLLIPKDMIPFDKRNRIKDKDVAICFYMHDVAFKQMLTSTCKYVEELKLFSCVISPDCSLYRGICRYACRYLIPTGIERLPIICYKMAYTSSRM